MCKVALVSKGTILVRLVVPAPLSFVLVIKLIHIWSAVILLVAPHIIHLVLHLIVLHHIWHLVHRIHLVCPWHLHADVDVRSWHIWILHVLLLHLLLVHHNRVLLIQNTIII
jgi:hypothetical protein